jgi:hypothetical protein
VKVKQALIVDPKRVAGDFTENALGLFDHTVTASLQEAEALATGAEYALILIAAPQELCEEAVWAMAERITRAVPEPACVMLYAEDAGAEFHAKAKALGISVVTAPLGVEVEALIDRARAG